MAQSEIWQDGVNGTLHGNIWMENILQLHIYLGIEQGLSKLLLVTCCIVHRPFVK